MKNKSPSESLDREESGGLGEDNPDESIGDPNHSLNAEARNRNPFLAEDQELSDAEDDNLSDLFASMGVEERLDELGL
jgi:hypothetical protein